MEGNGMMRLVLTLVLSIGVAGFVGCGEATEPDEPGEENNVTEEMGEAAEETGEALGEAAEETGEAVEEGTEEAVDMGEEMMEDAESYLDEQDGEGNGGSN